MDSESTTNKDEKELCAESLSGQSTAVLSEETTPNMNEKRARSISESSQTSIANKVAKLTPRATRSSQNPDFAAKQRKFLNRVHDPIRGNNSDNENSQSSPIVTKGTKENKPRSSERKTPTLTNLKRKQDKETTPKRPADSDDEGSAKKKRTKEPTKVVGGVDSYCWRCHRDGSVIPCECAPCPRVYHIRCVQLDKNPELPWMCPECSLITQAEDTDTRSRAMRMLTLDQLCKLLQFALNRMKNHEGAEDFLKPVDIVQFPNYRDYIVKPMDLSQLERNIKSRVYGSTEAFLADAKWIVHNSIIFNSVQSKFTNTARSLLKLCRQEMQHIENCPDCYLNSHTRASDSWFTEACRRPHILVWAKLKGFPFWPAKVMSVNSESNQVDVRFFGAHDRAWIPLNQCYLYSKLSPTPTTNNKNKRTLEGCLQELEYHIKRLRDKFGQFEHAPYKTAYDPKNEDAQLMMMLPQYEFKIMGKRSRLSLHHDGARKSLNRQTASPKRTPPEKQAPAEAVGPTNTGADQDGEFMVTICDKSKRTPTKEDRNVTPVPKKKTPLTAAAKKCFATDKICAKCNWHTSSVNEDSLCSNCSILDDNPQIHYKKDESIGDTNSTVRGTVTVQRKRAIMGEGDQNSEVTTESFDSQIENVPDIDRSEDSQSKPETEMSESVKETPAVDTESPTKFVIHKGLDSSEVGGFHPHKKGKIADKLQDKLCTTVIEAIKVHMTPEDVQEIEQEKEVDSSPEKTTELLQTSAQETSSAVVVLHDLKNNKEIMGKIRESGANNTTKNKDEVETQSASEMGSEVETDLSSCGDSDSLVVEGTKKSKKKNINKVVQNLKERKGSVDEHSEQSKATNTKDSNTLMLDDSVEESPILIIDEGESSDSKKSSSSKSDKSRRKGIPAKVHSRSSTSTESSEVDSRLTESRNQEVLDEASGHFRRSSGENNVTITVVTEEGKPEKRKTSKEIRSVNISKSLSLSVIKDSAVLEPVCIENDEDEVIIDAVKTVPPRPTARKTLPNPPPPLKPVSANKRPASVPLAGTLHPPPLVSLKQNKGSGPTKPPPSPSTSSKSAPPVAKPSPMAEVGPAHAKLEEVTQKVVTFMRSAFEEMLRASAEAGGENVEGLRQAHQLELEKLRWQHNQEKAELKHNTDLVIMEVRASMEAEKQRALLDQKHKFEVEKEQAISETKRRQWCAYCQKEAQLYCCWNTSYCSYQCQQEHWVPHMNDCRNKQTQDEVPPQRTAGSPAYPQVGLNS